ncbi:hypothetical protein [Larkinella rosea]|nr:hypothetical protein [Larkinella rosea]
MKRFVVRHTLLVSPAVQQKRLALVQTTQDVSMLRDDFYFR